MDLFTNRISCIIFGRSKESEDKENLVLFDQNLLKPSLLLMVKKWLRKFEM